MSESTNEPIGEPADEPSDALQLYTLCSDLGEVESQLEGLTAERDQLRAQISEIVERLGGKASVRGFGELQIASPVKIVSYDRKGLETLTEELAANGYEEIAEAIRFYRKESARSGGLRINRVKPAAEQQDGANE
ncbi:MAG TPA: hypothetical protein VGE07_09940 [Herpetosiphonaceae bacterium]